MCIFPNNWSTVVLLVVVGKAGAHVTHQCLLCLPHLSPLPLPLDWPFPPLEPRPIEVLLSISRALGSHALDNLNYGCRYHCQDYHWYYLLTYPGSHQIGPCDVNVALHGGIPTTTLAPSAYA